MNRSILFLIISVFLLTGCTEKKKNSYIGGSWSKGKPEKIYLFSVENGKLELVQQVVPEEGEFSFDFEPSYEGWYVVGTNATYPLNNYTFYLKPGDDLYFDVDSVGYHLTGENTNENKVMEKWEDYMSLIRDASLNYNRNKSTYKEFFPLLEEQLGGVAGFEAGATSNKKFNKAFEEYKEYDYLYNALFFLMTPRSAFPEATDYTPFYKDIELQKVTANEKLLDFPYGMAIVNMTGVHTLTTYLSGLPEEEQGEARKNISPLTFITPQIVDKKIRGEYLVEQITRVSSFEKVKDIYDTYGDYLVTDSQKERFQNYMQELGKTASGSPAIDFKFPDMGGNEIALSDFKGKVVYIDVWATWCGPCRQEIPYLKVLEKEYHGKDIVFLSVSTDGQKDYEKWKKMVIDEGLEGVQLFAGDRARKEVIEPYRIKGIPRFMLIDKNGNIISNDAERPSSKDIRKVLDAALAK